MALVRVCRLSDVPTDRGWPVRVGHLHLAVFVDRGEVHVVDNLCIHAFATIDDGFVEDGCVVCPWHGWRFDLASGDHQTVFGNRPGLSRYETKVEDGWVMVDPDAVSGGVRSRLRR